jgi:hypothetical protein
VASKHVGVLDKIHLNIKYIVHFLVMCCKYLVCYVAVALKTNSRSEPLVCLIFIIIIVTFYFVTNVTLICGFNLGRIFLINLIIF